MATIYGANTLSTGYDVANSLRFNFSDDPRLSRTLSTPTNADKYTFSAWVKRDRPTTSAQDYAYLISFDIGGTLREHIRFSTGGYTNNGSDIFGYIHNTRATTNNMGAMLIGNFLYDTTGTNISAAGTIYWQIGYHSATTSSAMRPAPIWNPNSSEDNRSHQSISNILFEEIA